MTHIKCSDVTQIPVTSSTNPALRANSVGIQEADKEERFFGFDRLSSLSRARMQKQEIKMKTNK